MSRDSVLIEMSNDRKAFCLDPGSVALSYVDTPPLNGEGEPHFVPFRYNVLYYRPKEAKSILISGISYEEAIIMSANLFTYIASFVDDLPSENERVIFLRPQDCALMSVEKKIEPSKISMSEFPMVPEIVKPRFVSFPPYVIFYRPEETKSIFIVGISYEEAIKTKESLLNFITKFELALSGYVLYNLSIDELCHRLWNHRAFLDDHGEYKSKTLDKLRSLINLDNRVTIFRYTKDMKSQYNIFVDGKQVADAYIDKNTGKSDWNISEAEFSKILFFKFITPIRLTKRKVRGEKKSQTVERGA